MRNEFSAFIVRCETRLDMEGVSLEVWRWLLKPLEISSLFSLKIYLKRHLEGENYFAVENIIARNGTG